MHLINGLYDCHRSRAPVLAIAAQIPSAEIGSGYFQETHPEHLFAQCSHYCELVSQPEQMPRVLEIAMRTAVTRRGVSVVAIPGDIALRHAVEEEPRPHFPPPKPTVCPADNEIEQLAEVLNGSNKVTILGGAGCAGAHDGLMAVAGKLNAPIVHALRGKEFIEYDNPFDVGMTGLIGFSSGYFAMMDCDTLLMVGTDFPYRDFFPKQATIVQIDIRGEQLGRRTKVDYGLVGDTKVTLQRLLPSLKQNADDKHLRRSLDHYRKARKALDDLATEGKEPRGSHPQFVASVINDLAREDAIFSCDVGTPTIWASRYLTMNGKRRLLGSFIHGSMASAMPQAIGAQLAAPDRQVVALSGDGGISMLLGDLLTLHQLNLPVKIVVFRNDSLSFVELEMKANGFLDFGVELKNPDFAALAESAGILGIESRDRARCGANVAQGFQPRRASAGRSVRTSPGTFDASDNHRRASVRLWSIPRQRARVVEADGDRAHAARKPADVDRDAAVRGGRAVPQLAEEVAAPALDRARARQRAGVAGAGGDRADAAREPLHVDRDG